MKTKICTKCKKEFPATEEYFHKCKKGKFGLKSVCKGCRNKDRHLRYENNKEKVIEQCKLYRQENKTKIAEHKKQYFKENKTWLLAHTKIYKNNNKEIIKEKNKRYREENKKLILIRCKIYRMNNKDKIHKYYQENKDKISDYKRRNRDKYTAIEQRRRARKKELPSTLTPEQWENIKTVFNNTCAYCGSKSKLDQEHFVPVSKGGEYTHNNIIPACRRCNSSKNNSDFFGWYHQQKFYSKIRENKILKFLNYYKNKQQLKFI